MAYKMNNVFINDDNKFCAYNYKIVRGEVDPKTGNPLSLCELTKNRRNKCHGCHILSTRTIHFCSKCPYAMFSSKYMVEQHIMQKHAKDFPISHFPAYKFSNGEIVKKSEKKFKVELRKSPIVFYNPPTQTRGILILKHSSYKLN